MIRFPEHHNVIVGDDYVGIGGNQKPRPWQTTDKNIKIIAELLNICKINFIIYFFNEMPTAHIRASNY